MALGSQCHDQLIMSAMDAGDAEWSSGSICTLCSHCVESKKSLRTTSVFNILRTFPPFHSTFCSRSWLPLGNGEGILASSPTQDLSSAYFWGLVPKLAPT